MESHVVTILWKTKRIYFKWSYIIYDLRSEGQLKGAGNTAQGKTQLDVSCTALRFHVLSALFLQCKWKMSFMQRKVSFCSKPERNDLKQFNKVSDII